MTSLHLYPMGKGDPLCPLGFHPQVRWPTRCKRCFRDYKEHGGKRREPEQLRKDEITASSPSLGTFGNSGENRRSWASSSHLSIEKKDRNDAAGNSVTFPNPSSWTSTPDLANLEDNVHANIPTVSLTLPFRKKTPLDTGQKVETPKTSAVFNKNDSLSVRAKKLKEATQERPRRIHIKEIKQPVVDETSSNDVQFLIQVKSNQRKSPTPKTDHSDIEDDQVSLAGTETTESTTLVDRDEFDWKKQVKTLREELDNANTKCERLEKEKSNILLRRLTAMDSSKGNTSEVLKLQQKVNELQGQVDDYRDEKKALNFKVKELEEDLENRPTPQATQKLVDELRSKLLAAETLCEELMDENEDMKKEMRDLEDEMEEMQDNFREDQADEYTSLKKELEQTTKNCRILSFKLRKTERRTEQLDHEKQEAEKKLKELSVGNAVQHVERIKQLEKEVATAKEQSASLQKKLDEIKAEERKSGGLRKRAPALGNIGKSASTDTKVSRESLTRGGSQDDPVQLLRDLQDSLEREADVREQLKFAEEEAQNLRKKASRIEDDNDSLALQLKKMATRSRLRKTPSRESEDKSEDETSDLNLQLELSEQETSVLRKKLEELQTDNERLKKKSKELQDKLITKPLDRRGVASVVKDNVLNDKIKALESELGDLKKKLTEKERECERLESEISLSKKRQSPRLKSTDTDQQTIDLKRQLQLMEQEASVSRSKAQMLEGENEKLLSENKRLELMKATKSLKTDKALDVYVDKIAALEIELETANEKIKELEAKPKANGDMVATKQIKSAEKERDKLQAILDKLKDNNSQAFKKRKVNSPTDLTTKMALKTMVNDLENEIAAILITLTNVEKTKEKLEQQLSNANDETTKKDVIDLQSKLQTIETESSKSKAELSELNKKLATAKSEKDNIARELTKLTAERDKMISDNKKLNEEIARLQQDATTVAGTKKELNDLSENNEQLRTEIKTLKSEVEEKSKLTKELTLKTKKINELQKQIKQFEESNDKIEQEYKDKIKLLEEKVADEQRKNKARDSYQIELSEEWNEKYMKITSESRSLSKKIIDLENTIRDRNTTIEKLEKDLDKQKYSTISENKQINNLNDEMAKLKRQLEEHETKQKNAEKSLKTTEEKLKKAETEFQSEKVLLEKKSADLEIDLQNEKKKLLLMKTNAEKEQKNRELELSALKNKIKSLESSSSVGSKKLGDIKEYKDKIEKLEKELSKEKKEYENLTSKYEVLEEEHVVTKARLVTEKESLSSQLNTLRREMEDLEDDREAIISKKKTLEKEKNEISEKLAKSNGNENFEKVRLKALLEESQSDLDQLKKEHDVINDQMCYMRKENDELKRKLDDYEKVSKIQRNISADSSAMDKEIRELKIKLSSLEKTKKSDLNELKMRYENQNSILNEEMQSLHAQVQRFKREKDTYKHMLESAQKTIANPGKMKEQRNSIGSNFDDLEEQKSKVAALEQQISCMEDELSESRLEGSKLKTELISERSSWEVKMSEMHSRVNELEEEKILSSGRTKIMGLRTRMELSWQKEREEQQRLLQETATLARDLRQTLLEVERERDKEVLEGKRKMEQLKKTLEEEQEENKKKLSEIQCDFMELRDAHAKLRTTNEKLRREKDRQEKDREEMKFVLNSRKRVEQEDLKRVNTLVQQVEALLQLAPELFGNKESSVYTPTPPKRTKSKSREGSPSMERKDYSRESSIVREDKRTQVQSTLQRLVDATDELKRLQRLSEEDRERDRVKRTMGMRRATSTENENGVSSNVRKLQRKDSNLQRKSLSLEHTASIQDRNIWKGDDDSMSSLQSLDMGSDIDFRRQRDVSLDSRLSGGSTQSEMVGGEKRKKKGLMGKLKKLTKSRSIDDQEDDHFPVARPLASKPSSNSELAEDHKGSKKDLKDRITGMFKRGGSSSRSNSVERHHDTSSTQRPLMRNGSGANLSSKDSSTDKVQKAKKNAKS